MTKRRKAPRPAQHKPEHYRDDERDQRMREQFPRLWAALHKRPKKQRPRPTSTTKVTAFPGDEPDPAA